MALFIKHEDGVTRPAQLINMDERQLPQFLSLYAAASPAPLIAAQFYPHPEQAYCDLLLGGEMWGLVSGDKLVAAAGWYMPAASQRDCLCGEEKVGFAALTGSFVLPHTASQQPQLHLIRRCVCRALAGSGCTAIHAYSPLRDGAHIALLLQEGFSLCGFDEAVRCLPRYVFCKKQRMGCRDISFCLPLADSYRITRALADGAVGFAVGQQQGEQVLWMGYET